MIETDIAIIGAGPVGLFTAFEAGMHDMSTTIIDVLEYPGGNVVVCILRKLYMTYPHILKSRRKAS